MTSDDTVISVWVQIEGNEPTKIKIHPSADINDLKQTLFPESNDEHSYHVYYRNEHLNVGERVPLDTNRHQPLTLTAILAPAPTIPDDNSGTPQNLSKTIKEVVSESREMVDQIFKALSNDMNIIVCGSPRVGKSTLINAIYGQEVAEAKEGLDSVTQAIRCYTIEGCIDTGSSTIPYAYNFWDAPGFESWGKNYVRSQLKEIIEKPQSKPVCMIFCASPGTFVDLTQLDWLLNFCIKENHIFCALVCTNKHAGQTRSLNAVLDTYNNLLSKYANEPPRIENDIRIYGNIGLSASVNSAPYEMEEMVLPKSGVNELIYGIMESLADDKVLEFVFAVMENKGFWTKANSVRIMQKLRKILK